MDFYEKKLNSLNKEQVIFTLATTTNEKEIVTRYQLAFHIVKTSKPHTNGEDLISPAAVEMVQNNNW